jgi:hypothetical protein
MHVHGRSAASSGQRVPVLAPLGRVDAGSRRLARPLADSFAATYRTVVETLRRGGYEVDDATFTPRVSTRC